MIMVVVVAPAPVWDMRGVFPEAKSGARFDITREWPDAAALRTTLDRNQLDALKFVLTSELAFVQGPPGTGAGSPLACLPPFRSSVFG